MKLLICSHDEKGNVSEHPLPDRGTFPVCKTPLDALLQPRTGFSAVKFPGLVWLFC